MSVSRLPLVTRSLAALAVAGTLGLTAIAPTPAQAAWHGGYGYGWHGGYGYRGGWGYRGYGWGPGAIVGGALLGLGVGAAVAGAYAPPPAYYYPPPPAYYYPPPAAPYYAPPPPPSGYAPPN